MEIVKYSNEFRKQCLTIFDSNCPKYFTKEEREEFADWLDNKTETHAYWVLLKDEKVVGCAGVYQSEDIERDNAQFENEVGFAWGMVANELHKNGYGKQLFEFRIAHLNKHFRDCPIVLRTTQHTAPFFAKYGFETVEFKKDGWEPGMDKYVMVYHNPEEAILETKRLRLRLANPVLDAPQWFLLNSDPEVVRYVGDGAFKNKEEAEQRIALMLKEQQEKYGYSRYAVVEKATGNHLGWCGLKYREEEDYVDLGYRFFQCYWGKGFASESAKAVLAFGHKELEIKEMVATAIKGNVGSERVMQKLGMEFIKDWKYEGIDAVWYRSVS